MKKKNTFLIKLLFVTIILVLVQVSILAQADAGDDIEVCDNDLPKTVQLSAGNQTGQWALLDPMAEQYLTIESPTSFNSNIVITDWVYGPYYLTWTISGFAPDTMKIVNNSVSATATTETASVCETFALVNGNSPNINNGETGDWLPLNSPVYFDDHSSSATIVRGLVPGNNQMTWNIYKAACSAVDTLEIFYLTQGAVNAGEDVSLIAENISSFIDTFRLNAYLPPFTTGYWAVVQGNTVFSDSSDPNTFISSLIHGETILRWTVDNGNCSASDNISLTSGFLVLPEIGVSQLNWTNPTSWIGGLLPGPADSVSLEGVNGLVDGGSGECHALNLGTGTNFDIGGAGTLTIGSGGLRIGSGSIFNVNANTTKVTGDGGSLYVRGGSVIIEQDAEKASGSGGTMYVRGSVIIEQDAEKAANLKAVSSASGNNLVIRRGGSVIIEQDAEKSTLAGGLLLVRSGGSIIVGDTIATTLDSSSALMYVKSGTVNIETPTLKAAGAGSGTLYVRGGSVIIEQDAEKATYKTEIIAPKTEVYNGRITIGQLSGVKVVGSGFRTGSIIIEQDAEKSTKVDTSLIIKRGGSLLIDNNMDPNAAFSLSIGSNTYVTFEEGSEINLDYAQTGTVKPVILKQGASLLDMNTADQLPAKFEHSFMQNIPVLFSSPFDNVNSTGFSTDATISVWNETDKSWANLGTSTYFMAMEGFKVLYPTINCSVSIEGTLNTGNVNKSLDFSSNSIAGEIGWNLTGNPYPSAIIWDSVNTDNISAAVYTYNEQTKQYNVYMKGGISLNGAIPYLEVGKAFFVRANDANVSFSLTNAARAHYDFTTPLKATPSDYLKLAVEGNSYSDEVIIRFVADATNDYDAQYDAFKLLAEDDAVPQIYSILASDASKMAINTLTPPGNSGVTVPLDFKASVDGAYKISVKELNFATDVSVVLKDLKDNITQDLRTNPDYSFTYTNGDPVNRFEIQFGAGITAVDKIENQELNVDIYSNKNNIYIKTFDDNEYRYEVYDIQGKVIQADKLINRGLNTIELNTQQGIYIVKVSSGNLEYKKKVVITNKN